tara:strand:+ start:679 stop:933 length:255 start_codon:yes stop_codon:yes gene_type:complete
MKEDITIQGSQTVYVPGLMDWCMACTKTTFDKKARDVAARMFALSAFIPEVDAATLRGIAEKKIKYSIDEERNEITLHTKEEQT